MRTRGPIGGIGRGALAAALGLLATAALARDRASLDRGWRFSAGDAAPFSLLPAGAALGPWQALVLAGTGTGADLAAVPAPAGAAAGWRDAAVGEDVFGGRTGLAWFRTTLPDLPAANRAAWFGSVDDNAAVYLNGTRLAIHRGWNDPFEVKLDRAWKRGGPNVLLVLVENTGGPGRIADAVAYSGTPRMTAPAAANTGYDDSAWREVTVPHDDVVEGTVTPTGDVSHGFYPHGVGWYRRSFRLANADKGKRIWLEFDGVYRDAVVWLNGTYLGRHPSGYTSFHFDVTDVAAFGWRNVVTVRCDATENEGWWYEGGGIYRHTWLTKLEPVHVDRWGVQVTTPEVSPEAATVRVKADVRNDGAASREVSVEEAIVDAQGRTVAAARDRLPVGARKTAAVVGLATLKAPKLWSPDDPNLYTLVTTLKAGKTELDRVETPFGVRRIRFDAARGFLLNGKPLKLQGTCNHQDLAGVGIALPDGLQEYKIATLKAWGANAYRCAHHPPAPELLDACDRLGMLVMDENRHLGDSPEILGEVEAMVRRDRNHPCVVIWSTCNEEGEQGTPRGRRMGEAIAAVIRTWDPTRPITSAMNQADAWGRGLSLAEDVQGTNYNPDRYDAFHRAHPAMPVVATEITSATTTRGVSANDPVAGYVTSRETTTESSWRAVAERPWMAGGFVWSGFDYRGEPTPYEWPCVTSHFGFLDLTGQPKDNAWYYKAWWGTEPVVHLFPHWNREGKVSGQPQDVWCYTNCEEVGLWLNGHPQGTRKVPRFGHVAWTVPFEGGELVARGFRAGQEVATDRLVSTGAAYGFRLDPSKRRLKGDGEDALVIHAAVTDQGGSVVPVAAVPVTFAIQGPGRILGVGNGNPSDHDPEAGVATRTSFNGWVAVVIQSTGGPGVIQVSAVSPGLQPGSVGVAVDDVPPRPAVPAN